jgi:hypothetical protein
MLTHHFNGPTRAACAAGLLALLAGGCRFDGPQAGELVTSLRFSPSAFDSFRRNTELKYALTEAAVVDIRIVRRTADGAEVAVKTLARSLRETRGTHAVTWLGDTAERLFAPAGVYVGVVEVRGERFETSVEVFHF